MLGTSLSHYEITAELGRGGMGIVYKARDTKLDRTVAIKVLPAAALASQDDRARFYREAKAAAALNHPNIAQIYQIDEAVPEGSPGDDVRPYIAMEFIEGGTLEDRIKSGPLKLDEAVRIATQVAEALKAAHAKQIVHRDIKSANIMLTADGQAKVLDFGLAQTSHSTKLTRMGSTLGTVAYMSPEQARGEEVDGRTDLYSLGTVLYEMIAGKLPFGGEYEQAVVYSILNADPEPLTALRTGVPMELESVVTKALRKNPALRYQSSADMVADLAALKVASGSGHGPVPASSTRTLVAAPGKSGLSLPFVVGAFMAGVLLTWALFAVVLETPDKSKAIYRFDMALEIPDGLEGIDISPDGSTLAMWVNSEGPNDIVLIYDFPTGQYREVPSSEAADVIELSQDGSSMLITTAIGVQRASTRVGAPINLFYTNEGTPRANWSPEGALVYEDSGSIFIKRAESSEPYPVILSDTTRVGDLDWPSILPDGKTVMAVIEYDGERRDLGFWDIETGKERTRIEQGGYRPQYVPSGHIFMVLGSATAPGDLVAMPFDLDKLEQRGPLIPLETGVSAEKMAVSDNGTLVYQKGGVVGTFDQRMLYLISMSGATEQLDFEPALYGDIKVSPDGSKAILTIVDGESTARIGDAMDTFVIDLETQRQIRLTEGLSGGSGDWYAGSDSVIYVDNANRSRGEIRVRVRAANGSGVSRELFQSNTGIHDVDVSQDGLRVVYTTGQFSNGNTQLEVRNLVTGEVLQLSDGSPAQRSSPVFSPDGSQIFYMEGTRGWTRSVDGTGVPTVSPGNGQTPVWEAQSGIKFSSARLARRIWQGIDSDELNAVNAPGIVRAMDALPGGNTLLVAVGVPGGDEGDDTMPGDSLRTLSVVMNVFEALK